ncbi:hypothetical protein N7470_006611 [Penicillium chermesinum]|nr:hypothetical protein N7470_006611 [Penicillium chermesinum]
MPADEYHGEEGFIPEASPPYQDTDATHVTRSDAPSPSPASAEQVPYTCVAKTEMEIFAALRLIADSVAQQHQAANRALLHSPIFLGAAFAVLCILLSQAKSGRLDTASIIPLCAALLMVAFSATRYCTKGYLDQAEMVGTLQWLYGDMDEVQEDPETSLRPTENYDSFTQPRHRKTTPEKDSAPNIQIDKSVRQAHTRTITFISYWKGEVIAVLVMTLACKSLNRASGTERACCTKNPIREKPSSSRASISPRPLNEPVAIIRAWTVKQKYRGNNLGLDILEYVVRFSYGRGWKQPVFAEDHAHSLRLVPWPFEKGMETDDERAKRKLAEVGRQVVGFGLRS